MSDANLTPPTAAVRKGAPIVPSLGLPEFVGKTLRATLRGLADRDAQSSAEVARLKRQMTDYARGGLALFWQRQGMYFGSAIIAAAYYHVGVAVLCFLLLQATEAFDTSLFRKVVAWEGQSAAKARKLYRLLMISSLLSSLGVATFTLLVTAIEGATLHFAPLMFLFAAGIFAAVNNHQLPGALLIRLTLYGVVFLLVPAMDIAATEPGARSDLWLQLITVAFVLFFVIECSLIFLRLYRSNLDQLDELRIERDRARAALEIKSQFVSVVSHELRTPLTSILASLSLLDSGNFKDDPERTAEVIGIAHLSSKRLNDLINDLLDIQKIESGQMKYHFRVFAVGPLLQDCANMMEGMASKEGIRILLEMPRDDLMVRADNGRLAQVVNNLLSNAIKFSHKGDDVRISAACEAGKVRIMVADAGIGIPPGSQDLVFGKFSQVDASDHRSHQGTGLGLNLVRQIMQAHGGTVDYSSEPGKGTTFVLTLDAISGAGAPKNP